MARRSRLAAKRSWRRMPPGRSDRIVMLRKTSSTRPMRKPLKRVGSGSGGARSGAAQRRAGVVEGDPRAPEVVQGEAVARGLRRGLLLQLLVQIPVQPFVAVEEPENVAARAEHHVLREPREVHALAARAAGAVVDDLLERSKRGRHLQDDPPPIEVAERGQMRGRAVAQRLDHDLVAGGGQPGEEAPGAAGREVWKLAPYLHVFDRSEEFSPRPWPPGRALSRRN